jgi:hypothetical protein
MNQALKIGICAVAGVMMQTAIALPASAEYLGYDNGDPGNWDYNTEQAGGPCNLPGAHAIDAVTGQPKCCSQYNPMSACPIASAEPRHLYRSARRDHNPQS